MHKWRRTDLLLLTLSPFLPFVGLIENSASTAFESPGNGSAADEKIGGNDDVVLGMVVDNADLVEKRSNNVDHFI